METNTTPTPKISWVFWTSSVPFYWAGCSCGEEAPSYYIRETDSSIYKLYERMMRQDHCKAYFPSLETAKAHAEELEAKR